VEESITIFQLETSRKSKPPVDQSISGLANKVEISLIRFVVVCGDGEYIIYTAMALRNKSFGSAQEFVWAADSSEYAVRENASTVKLFKNFKERKTFRPDFGAEAIFGGRKLFLERSLQHLTPFKGIKLVLPKKKVSLILSSR